MIDRRDRGGEWGTDFDAAGISLHTSETVHMHWLRVADHSIVYVVEAKIAAADFELSGLDPDTRLYVSDNSLENPREVWTSATGTLSYRQQLGLLEHRVGRRLLLVGRVAVLAEDALHDHAQRGARVSFGQAFGLGHDAIEVALEQSVLRDAVLLELALGVRPGDLRRHRWSRRGP